MNVLKPLTLRVWSQNQNCLMLIVGETGSGKSWTGLKIGEELDPSFSIDRVAFTAEEFAQMLNKDDIEKGQAIMFDEAGVGLKARNWYTEQNKKVIDVLQTFRFKNLFVIFTVPSAGFIDKNGRKLFHYLIETQKVLKEAGRVRCKMQRMEYSPKADIAGYGAKDGIYYKRPRVVKNGRLCIVDKVEFGKPSVKLRHAYEKKSAKFKQKVIEDLQAYFDAQRRKRQTSDQRNQEIIDKYLERGKKVTGAEVYATHSIGRKRSFALAKYINKKLQEGKPSEEEAV